MKLFSCSKKNAVILSYVGIVIQAFSTFFLTRFYLSTLGEDTYGLYQMINSVAQYILVLDLGISTVMIRYISEFDSKGDHQKSENFAFHFGIIVFAIIAFIVAACIILNRNIENIYQTLTPNEYALSHTMFRFIVVQLVATVICHFFQGIAFAYGQYVFDRVVTIVCVLLNIALNVGTIYAGFNVIGIVLANAAVIVLHTLVAAAYAIFAIHFRIRFHGWDFPMLRPAFLLMIAMLLQSIVGYVNSSVDKTILGIMATKADVSVYSIAATIITMFNTIPTAISSVFQPDAVRLVARNANTEELTSFVIKPGRLQFMLLGGFFAGFILFGKDFIICWTNKTTMDTAWLYVLVIMLPNAVPLVQNTCLAILNALDKRIYRSIVLVGMTGVNILLTVISVRLFGPFGAPLATAISYLIGHVILMNIYYQKRIGLNIRRMFREITGKTTICVLLAFIVNLPLVFWKQEGNWGVLLAKMVVFCVVYAVLLVKLAFNNRELNMVNAMLKRMHIKRGLRSK